MSNIPGRTRSLRRPVETGGRDDRSFVADSSETNAASRLPESGAADRNSRSPSRLPLKLPTRSTSTTARPPSSAGTIISNASSMRPPPPRATPTTAGLQRSSSTRKVNPPLNAEPVKQDRSRPPLTSSRHFRNVSSSSLTTSTRVPGHTRTKSSSTILSGPTTLRPQTRGSTEEYASRTEPADPQLKKPAFSTLQQHFSPAKSLAPKPHPAAFLAPPSPSKLPSNIAISAETSKLQNELLQLHLLHKNVTEVEKEWRASAKRKLGAQFQSVVHRNETLTTLEVEETAKVNAAALKKWQDLGTPGWGLEEKVQVLDEVLSGVWNLGASGGKYARVVRKFERWLDRCQDISEARSSDDGLIEEIIFVEELDRGWKDDCLVLTRKLETWQDHLKNIGSPGAGSSLATVVDACQSLVRGMLMELNVMAQIERDAVSMELNWIRSMNDVALDDDEDVPVGGAAWRYQ